MASVTWVDDGDNHKLVIPVTAGNQVVYMIAEVSGDGIIIRATDDHQGVAQPKTPTYSHAYFELGYEGKLQLHVYGVDDEEPQKSVTMKIN